MGLRISFGRFLLTVLALFALQVLLQVGLAATGAITVAGAVDQVVNLTTLFAALVATVLIVDHGPNAWSEIRVALSGEVENPARLTLQTLGVVVVSVGVVGILFFYEPGRYYISRPSVAETVGVESVYGVDGTGFFALLLGGLTLWAVSRVVEGLRVT